MQETLFSLHGRHILVTGAASGIGRQTAITLSQHGATLTLLSRREEQLQEMVSLLTEPEKHAAFPLDVTRYEALEEVIGAAVQKAGGVSGFVHSAGMEMTKPLAMLKPQNYEEVFAVNVIAGFELAKILAKKKYAAQAPASFVFIASVVSTVGQPAKIAYSSSKGALIAGVKSMALELAPKRIRVNAISPAVIETEMSRQWINHLSLEEKERMIQQHPLGLGTTEDVANACLFLLSEAARWITGTNLIVDGGYSAH
jgi:NAD(P)-dependent dehydrogenase (short-subunit alcohol dehydrogenase family)